MTTEFDACETHEWGPAVEHFNCKEGPHYGEVTTFRVCARCSTVEGTTTPARNP